MESQSLVVRLSGRVPQASHRTPAVLTSMTLASVLIALMLGGLPGSHSPTQELTDTMLLLLPATATASQGRKPSRCTRRIKAEHVPLRLHTDTLVNRAQPCPSTKYTRHVHLNSRSARLFDFVLSFQICSAGSDTTASD